MSINIPRRKLTLWEEFKSQYLSFRKTYTVKCPFTALVNDTDYDKVKKAVGVKWHGIRMALVGKVGDTERQLYTLSGQLVNLQSIEACHFNTDSPIVSIDGNTLYFINPPSFKIRPLPGETFTLRIYVELTQITSFNVTRKN